MKLITKAIARKLPPLGSQDGKDATEVKVPLKLFDPTGSWTWYLTEFDPVQRLFFGFVVGLEEELGYVSLDELESVRGRFGIGLERDKWWDDSTSLAAVQTGETR